MLLLTAQATVDDPAMRFARFTFSAAFMLLSAADVSAADLAVQPVADVIQLQPFQFTFTNDTQFYQYSGNRAYVYNVTLPKGKGYQVYSPFSLEATGDIAPSLSLDTII